MNPKSSSERTEKPALPRCPFCDSTNTELISLFGQTLMGSQYYCHTCRSVFESVRWTSGEGNDAFEKNEE